jgi:hypothetical protein
MSKLSTLLMLAKEQIALKRGKITPKGVWIFNFYFLGNQARKPLPCCKKYYDNIDYEPLGLYEHFKSVEHVANANGQRPSDLQATIDKNNKRYSKFRR